MADNITALANTGTGTDVLATDDIGGVQYPRVKMVIGADGVNGGDVSSSNPMPVSAASLPLPAGASTETTLAALNTKTPAVGQATMAASRPVVIASDQSAIPMVQPALLVTGQAAQTAVVNNILTVTAGPAATDVSNYRSASIQVISTGTGGTFIFEQSNDNVNFRPLPVFNSELTTGVPIVAAITATASQIVYTIPLRCSFLRLRIASTITGGSIRAFTRLSTEPWTPSVATVAQPTAGSLNATVSGSVSLGGGGNGIGSVFPQQFPSSDVGNASIAVTTTSNGVMGYGQGHKIVVVVGTVSGTNPTMDISVEESTNAGSVWTKVYDFPRITASGNYHSPVLNLGGQRVRYVQTLGGTSPSFVRAIDKVSQPTSDPVTIRQLIDRTVVLTTLNSVTPSLNVQNCERLQLVINIGTATTPPAIQLEGSDDNGATWYAVGSPLTAVASSTVQATTVNVNSQLVRGRISTAGVTVVAGYVLIKGF